MKRLLVALICTFLFTPLLSAREEPKTRVAKERRALEDQIFLKRSCEAPKKGVTRQFGKGDIDFSKVAGGSCWGECNCSECYCEYTDGDLGCCFDGCDACWEFLDEGGDCGISVE